MGFNSAFKGLTDKVTCQAGKAVAIISNGSCLTDQEEKNLENPCLASFTYPKNILCSYCSQYQNCCYKAAAACHWPCTAILCRCTAILCRC